MKHSPGFLRLTNAARRFVREVTPKAVKAKLARKEDFLLIDVREDHEWKQSHIRGAVHMARGIIERDIEKTVPDKHSEVVLYCGGGFRSVLAAESLRKMGYSNVASMKGGWRAWKRIRGSTTR